MKKLACLMLAVTMCLSLSGCYDSNEISRLAFIIAIGIDTASDGMYEYTFQVVKPSAFGTGESDDKPLASTVIESSTIYSAMDKLNSEISEKCDYSHIKLVVFSDKMVNQGINKEIEAMLKSNNFHPNTRVAMSDGKASEYLENIQIPLDTNPAEYYENIFKKDYTVYSPDTKLRDLEKKYKKHPSCNVLPIVKGKKSGGDDKSSGITAYNTNKMAVIKDLKLVAIAEHDDILWYNIITDNGFYNNFYTKIDGRTIATELVKKKKKIKVDLSDKKLKVSVTLKLDGNILWSEYGGEYIAEDKEFEDAIKGQIKTGLTEFLYKCSTDYKADILNISRLAKLKYLTIDAWESEDWQGLFENASYDVDVDISLKREGISLN